MGVKHALTVEGKAKKRPCQGRSGLKETGRGDAGTAELLSKRKLGKKGRLGDKFRTRQNQQKPTKSREADATDDAAESDSEISESPLGLEAFSEADLDREEGVEEGFDESEDDEAEGDRDEEEDENYEGAQWLADEEEEWASSEDEAPAHSDSEPWHAPSGVFADSPAAQKAFEGVLKKRLMKDKEFLSFLLQESAKQGVTLSPEASDSEEEAVAEDASEEDVPRDARLVVEDEEETPQNLLTADRYEQLCHLVGIASAETQRVEESAEREERVLPSLRSLQLFLGAFRSAVRQTGTRRDASAATGRAGERTKDDAKYRDGKKHGSEEKKRSATSGTGAGDCNKRRGPAERKSFFLLRDEDLRFTVLLRTVQQLPRIVRNFLATPERPQSGSSESGAQSGETEASQACTRGDVSQLVASPNWRRLRLPLRWFFADLCELLTALQSLSSCATRGKETLVQLLLCLARTADETLPLLLELSGAIPRNFLLTVARCWAFTKNAKEQLAAFASLRRLLLLRQRAFTGAAQTARTAKRGEKKRQQRKGEKTKAETADESERGCAALKEEAKVQEMLQTLLRAFQQATSRNVGSNGSRTWRGANRMQLLLNEYLELLRLADPRVVYRVAFQSIREMALTVRSVVVISSQATPKGKKTKTAFLHARRLAASQKLLYSWSFLSTARLWSAAFASCVSLRPLAFPLVTLLCAALKGKLTALAFSPFCWNLLSVLHQTALSTNLLVPLNSYLFASVELLLRHQSLLSSDRYTGKRARLEMQERQNKKKKKKRVGQKNDGEKDSLQLQHSRAADPEVALRLSAAQQDALHVIDGLVGHFQRLLTEHLGYLVLHPAFPEISLPIKRSLRRTVKMSKSQAVARSLKALIGAIESSAAVVQSLRCTLKDLPVGAVEIFTEKKQKASLPLFLLRQQVVEERRKFVEEKVQGELSAAAERKQAESDALKTPRQLKRERQKQRKQAERVEMEELSRSTGSAKRKRMREDSGSRDDRGSGGQSAKREKASPLRKHEEPAGEDDILDEIGSDLDDL
ncbi:Noc2p family protein [Toxoplasma gondii VEG]|uniref:Noc2p family protein n=1 Tax=Toxoplasma gondii (strain ATCC 50861 / VEG) TaxID=432359 RepID=B9QB60_TOXGV|nr:Noc2p family protein [Toxoplasma gondii VEG]CEL74339.1 TPA: Nucleolar complex protein 2, related [Toxoplasma gondii VEG]